MKIKVYLIAFSLLLSFNSFGQITFQKIFSRMEQSPGNPTVQQTYDGGYIIGGTNVLDTAQTVILIKTDKYGDTLWAKNYGNYNSTGQEYSIGYWVLQTRDSGYVIVGSNSNTTNHLDVYLVKTNSNGDTLWTKRYGSSDYDEGFSVQQTYDDGYIMTGYTQGGIYLVKADVNGNIAWTKTFADTGHYSNVGFSVQQTNDSGYILVGQTAQGISCLIKTNSNGDTLWTNAYSGIYAKCIEQTSDSGYILGGSNSNVFQSACLCKTDVNGNIQWTKAYGDSIHYRDCNAIWKTNDGGYILSGVERDTGQLAYSYIYNIKTNAVGDTLWTRAYGSAVYSEGYSIMQTSDSGYILVGITRPEEMYLIKTDVNGNSGCNERNSPTEVKAVNNTISAPYLVVASQNNQYIRSSIVLMGDTTAIICFSVGINELTEKKSNLIAYPNPSTGAFHIESKNIKRGELSVYNVIGEKVYSNIFRNNEANVDVNLKQGIYFIQLIAGERSLTSKIIIE